MGRLPGFDYARPLFYMVTLKRRPGLADFSRLCGEENPPKDARGRPRYLIANRLTSALAQAIRSFGRDRPGLAPVETFIVMPDHIHLLLRLQGSDPRIPLGDHVAVLVAALSRTYCNTPIQGRRGSAPRDPEAAPSGHADRSFALFEPDWHDWIVKRDGQLAAFTRYIRENPMRAWRRRMNRRFFTQVRPLAFADREWFAYGNPDLLGLPVLEPFRCSRSWPEDGPEWRAALETARRMGPGCAGVGTFMSPCEKACGNAIFQAGGSLVVLAPEGFGERWHPTRAKEALCAEGRMLFLSLYPPAAARPDRATLYRRCHEMGDLVCAALQHSDPRAREMQHSDPQAREMQHSDPQARGVPSSPEYEDWSFAPPGAARSTRICVLQIGDNP